MPSLALARGYTPAGRHRDEDIDPATCKKWSGHDDAGEPATDIELIDGAGARPWTRACRPDSGRRATTPTAGDHLRSASLGLADKFPPASDGEDLRAEIVAKYKAIMLFRI